MLVQSDNSLNLLQERVKAYASYPLSPRDPFYLIVLEEALATAQEGNFGIGACLVRKETGEVILRGRNKVFKPYFRSDLHAEMDVLNRYEESVKGPGPDTDGLILFSSIEPCPMCLIRMITSGIREAYYLAPDPDSGMVGLRDKLPPVWQEIAKGRIYREADCSPELKDIALEIFRSSAERLDYILKYQHDREQEIKF